MYIQRDNSDRRPDGSKADRTSVCLASNVPPGVAEHMWRILRWCNLLKAGALSGPACSHGANYDGGINTVLMLGIDTVWGYNYAWHEVMRGLETDPQTEHGSQPRSLLRETHKFKETTAWLSTVFWRLRERSYWNSSKARTKQSVLLPALETHNLKASQECQFHAMSLRLSRIRRVTPRLVSSYLPQHHT